MKKRSSILAAVALIAFGFALLGSLQAHAQIDPYNQSFGVYQSDVLVGEIYREGTSLTQYTEHWILYPRYLYPSDTNTVTTVIHPSGRTYYSLSDFFARVPWSTGSRYARSSAVDMLVGGR